VSILFFFFFFFSTFLNGWKDRAAKKQEIGVSFVLD
jgi:hypothetical protein